MTMTSRKVITIDGLAGTGKSTLAKELSSRLSFQFFSSGLIYRAVGKLILDQGIDSSNEEQVALALSENVVEIKANGLTKNTVFLNGDDVSRLVFEPEVSEATSQASQLPTVRKLVLDYQRQVFPGQNIITEGRDMGTVVFPDADLKLFLDCDADVLIERRLQQFLGKNPEISEKEADIYREKLKIEITERNKRDSEREASPTKPASDAQVVDTTQLSLDQVVEFAHKLATAL